MNKLDIYIDGASKGNPGPSGIGIIIKKNGETVREIGKYIGRATNNIAEYTALLHALSEDVVLNADELFIRSDSELLCKQLNRDYKVKSANIIDLFAQANELLARFKQVSIQHIPREHNAHADKLATEAVKKALKR